MSQAPSIDDLFALSERLDTHDRVTLARWILESVASDEAQVDPAHAAAWDEELDRRLAAVRDGTAHLLEWDDAMKLIFADFEDE